MTSNLRMFFIKIIHLVSAFQKHITCISFHQLEFDLYLTFIDLSCPQMTLDFKIFNFKITSFVSAFQQVRGTTRCLVSSMKSIYLAEPNTESTESTASTESAQSTECTESTDPKESTDPTESTDSTDECTKSSESTDE